MNIVDVQKRLKARLVDFQISDTAFKDPDLEDLVRRLWEGDPAQGGLVSDLWVELTAASKSSGLTLHDLNKSKKISPEFFAQLERAKEFPVDAKLFLHQTKSLEEAKSTSDGRPAVVVVAGTGAGKTECFMFPMLDLLFCSQPETDKGVDAIILYPMNALVNDQVTRLTSYLKGQSEVTFVHFTSETPDTVKGAGGVLADSCRFQSRQDARKGIAGKKPRILVTNYSMLEYMLCRPDDSSFFGPNLKAFILDEAHLYGGTLAAEISLLLRRVYDRCGVNSRNVLQIATSATIGSSDPLKRNEQLKTFAAAIFSKSSEQIKLVFGEQEPLQFNARPGVRTLDWQKFASNLPPEIRTLTQDQNGNASLLQGAEGRAEIKRLDAAISVLQPKVRAQDHDFVGKYLKEVLSEIPEISAIGAILSSKKQIKLTELIERIAAEYAHIPEPALLGLLNLSSSARNSASDLPLIPQKVHLLMRPSTGIYVCANPDCNAVPSRKLKGLGTIHSDLASHCSCGSVKLELLVCKSCGQHAFSGRVDDCGRIAGPTFSFGKKRSTIGTRLLLDDDGTPLDHRTGLFGQPSTSGRHANF